MQTKKFHEYDLETYSFMLQAILFIIALLFLINKSVIVLLIIFGFELLNFFINFKFSVRMDSYWNTLFLNELGFDMSIPDNSSDVKFFVNAIRKFKKVNNCSLLYFKLIKQSLLRINVLSFMMFIFILVLQIGFPNTAMTIWIVIISSVLEFLVLVEMFLANRIFNEYQVKLTCHLHS